MRRYFAIIAIGTMLAFAPLTQVSAAVITIDFEALGNLDNAASYLTGFGISVFTEPGTALFAVDENLVYGGGVVNTPSGTMYLTQADAAGTGASAFPPNTFTLDFNTPLDSFGFSESAILVLSITSPWTATAYVGAGAILDTASFSGSTLHPVLTYTLVGPSIGSVTFVQTASSSAAFFAANLDDFILTTSATAVPEPSTLVIWSLGAVALVGLGRRRRNG